MNLETMIALVLTLSMVIAGYLGFNGSFAQLIAYLITL